MLYLISIPSPGASVISLESILYRFGCARNVPIIVGPGAPNAELAAGGPKTGAIVASAIAAGGADFPEAFARFVKPSAAPVRNGSIPYSLGSTAVKRTMTAIR